MIYDLDNSNGKEKIYEKKLNSYLETYQISGDTGCYLVGTYCSKTIICLPYEGRIAKPNNDDVVKQNDTTQFGFNKF